MFKILNNDEIYLGKAEPNSGSGGGGGGTTYTAGDGIDITNNVISVDGEVTDQIELQAINELSIDTVPTQNSNNLITSGAVYTAIGDIETALSQI